MPTDPEPARPDDSKSVELIRLKPRQRFDPRPRDAQHTLDRRLALANAGGMDALQAR
jgi:hypothetical protein